MKRLGIITLIGMLCLPLLGLEPAPGKPIFVRGGYRTESILLEPKKKGASETIEYVYEIRLSNQTKPPKLEHLARIKLDGNSPQYKDEAELGTFNKATELQIVRHELEFIRGNPRKVMEKRIKDQFMDNEEETGERLRNYLLDMATAFDDEELEEEISELMMEYEDDITYEQVVDLTIAAMDVGGAARSSGKPKEEVIASIPLELSHDGVNIQQNVPGVGKINLHIRIFKDLLRSKIVSKINRNQPVTVIEMTGRIL